MLRIVADDKIPFLKGILEPFANVTYVPGQKIDRDLLLNTDALLIRTRTKCKADLLKGTAVKFIGTATIGYDHIDTRYCEENKIFWTNAPGCNSYSVQQYIAAALLKIASDAGFSLKHKTLGIIGVGNVGSKVEKFARAIGMKVLLNDPPRERTEGKKNFLDFDEVLTKSDLITVHVPLNVEGPDKTYHMFNNEVFNKIRGGTWLLNSSRGEVVDTTAVKMALSTGKIAGAVVDVWENEPAIDPALMNLVNIATPHIAGYSTDGKANGTSMVVNALAHYFNLPLTSWYPESVPEPAYPEINIECTGKTVHDIVTEAVFHTYRIEEDDKSLRMAPGDFEKLRGSYPVRREFPSFVVNLVNGSEELNEVLRNIGFKVMS